MKQTGRNSVVTSDTRKRVLILTQRFPHPPDRGDRIRSYNLIKFLSSRFDITVGCTSHEPIAKENLETLKQVATEVIVGRISKLQRVLQAVRSVLFGASITEGYFYSPILSKDVRRLHEQRPFDALLIYCSSMFQYRRAGLEAIPTVVDLVDVDSEKWRQLSADASGPMRWVYRLETARTRKLEKKIALTAHSIALTSCQEAELFRRSAGKSTKAVGISNGVDTTYFRANRRSTPQQGEKTELVFTGVMDYLPNVEGVRWFCKEVLPLIKQRLPVSFKIVGRNPTQAVQDLNRIEGVEVVGEVPDVRPYLDAADIAVAPLHLARGIQNKVLEAMASGLPAVVTPQSAEGIAATSGVHLRIAASGMNLRMQWSC